MRTRVKICGITSLVDAQAAIAAGADALGFVFYPDSPRNVSVADAREICRVLPPYITKVALVVNPDQAGVRYLLNEVAIDVIQFHGDEPQHFCQSFDRPWYKAVRVKDQQAIEQALIDYDQANALLLDAFVAGVPGGTGQAFDWQLIPKTTQAIILAGGLTPATVGGAITEVAPFAVDVSGGVEASKGKKSVTAMNAFVQAVQQADARR